MIDDSEFSQGSLAVVALPLGNAGDFCPRAAGVLAAADMVAAEDTRTARRFLSSFGVKAKFVSYHDFNETARAKWLMERLSEGLRVALVSEAGTPCISDPGFVLVREARRQGFKVFPVPGPSALVTFLSASGLPTNAFSFLGFPPSKRSARRDFFSRLATREETLVFYESPHRFADALKDATEIFGEREAAFGREMTKFYEEFFYGPLSEMLTLVQGRERVKGEVTWGITGRPKGAANSDVSGLEGAMAQAIAEGRPLKEAAKELSAAFGEPSKKIYAALSRLRDTP